MYDPFIVDTDGVCRPTTISLTRDQHGSTVCFLDMQFTQDSSGTQVAIYNKRDHLPSLQRYRRFPHIESRVSHRCKSAVLHSQMCRFSVRCTRLVFFECATAKLLHDMLGHCYPSNVLRRKLFNFCSTFFQASPIHFPGSRSLTVRLRIWYRVQYNVWRRITYRCFDPAATCAGLTSGTDIFY